MLVMNHNSYIKWFAMSDKALVQTIGKYVQHHRLKLNQSQDQVATEAGISRSTLSLLERGETVTVSTLIQVLRALGLLHIMETFEVVEEISPIEYARLQKKARKKASPAKKSDNPETEDLGW